MKYKILSQLVSKKGKSILLAVLVFLVLTNESHAQTLWAWGNNYWAQLGDGTSSTRTTPVQIATAEDWKQVAAGKQSSIGIKSDGSLWGWGYNYYGQLGDGTNSNRYVPTRSGTATNWQQIASGYFHSIALKTDGTLWAWGGNDYGQVGDSTTFIKYSPVQIDKATDWKFIACGRYHSFAIKSDGSLWGWGMDYYSQLGDSVVNKIVKYPVRIGKANDWAQVAGGENHSVGIKTDGSLWVWGSNYYGQLANDTVETLKNLPNIPQRIGKSNDWKQVAAGLNHNVALKKDGTLWAWGRNNYGQLGDSSIIDKLTPTQIGKDNNWISVVAGADNYFAYKSDSSVWAWGPNGGGQLGNGTTGNGTAGSVIAPKQFGTAKEWVQISVGVNHTVAIKKVGSATYIPNPNKSNDIIIYPSITDNYLKIHHLTEPAVLSIVDLSGKMVLLKKITSSEEISISNLTSGVYILIVQTKNVSQGIRTKIIKN